MYIYPDTGELTTSRPTRQNDRGSRFSVGLTLQVTLKKFI